MNDYNKGRLKRTRESIEKGKKFITALELIENSGVVAVVIKSEGDEGDYNIISIKNHVGVLKKYLKELEDREMYICSREHLKQKRTVEGD